MKKRKSNRNEAKMNATYHAARAEAQTKANKMGMDIGLEWNDLFGYWNAFLLPQRQNRQGHELRCEVVSPDNVATTQPGHGYR